MTVSDFIIVRNLGLIPYEPVLDAMRAFTEKRTPETPDEIWLLEHPPIYTLGQAAQVSHLLDTKNIPVFQSDRGGEVTYHGPGQAVLYLLFDLKRRMKSRLLIKEFVYSIEQVIIDSLAKYHLSGERKAGTPGIYISSESVEKYWDGAKIAALGLKVKSNGCTYHGFSVNVAMDLTPFSGINPCGQIDLKSVDMKSLGVFHSVFDVQFGLAKMLCKQMNARADFQDVSKPFFESLMNG